MRKLLYLVPVLVLFFSSCKNNEKDHQELMEFRKKYWNSPEYMADPNKALLLDNMYKQYIQENPEDTLTAVFMYEDARLNLNVLDKPDAAVIMLDNLFMQFPEHRLAPVAMFTAGFTYENQLKNEEVAGKRYQMMLSEYPEHPYADQAKLLMKYLGKDPAEILRNETDSFRNTENAY